MSLHPSVVHSGRHQRSPRRVVHRGTYWYGTVSVHFDHHALSGSPASITSADPDQVSIRYSVPGIRASSSTSSPHVPGVEVTSVASLTIIRARNVVDRFMHTCELNYHHVSAWLIDWYMASWIAVLRWLNLFDAARGRVSKPDYIILWSSAGLRSTILPIKVIHLHI